MRKRRSNPLTESQKILAAVQRLTPGQKTNRRPVSYPDQRPPARTGDTQTGDFFSRLAPGGVAVKRRVLLAAVLLWTCSDSRGLFRMFLNCWAFLRHP